MPPEVDVPVAESSVEDRMERFFGGNPPEPTAPQKPELQPQEPASQEAAEPVNAVSDEPAADGQEEGEQQEPASEEPPEGFVELEHLGKKYFVEPDLKTAFEANRAQATRSAMELAPVRKALEVEKMALQATKAFNDEMKDIVAQQAQLQSYKEQARKIDWSALTLDQKVDLDRELRNVDEQLSQVESKLSASKQQHEQQFGRFVLDAVSQTEKYMGQKVPGWNEATGKALHDYGLNYGIPPEKLTAGWFADPTATHIMWKAQQWDKLQSSKPGVQNKVSNVPPVSRPGSSAVQKSVQQSNYQKARGNLKKTGSLDAFAEALLLRQKR